MGLLKVFWDTATGSHVFKSAVDFSDEFFTSSGQTQFSLVTNIDGTNSLDVFVNGVLKEETSDYTIDTVNDRVDFTYTVPSPARVRVRIYGA